MIQKNWKDELYKYITGIVQNHDHKLIQINGMPDHIHILIGMRPKQSLSDLIKIIKQDSSKWINENKKSKSRFSWQAGYGAFSCDKTQLPRIAKYIQNQEQHHSRKSYRNEYIDFLKVHEIKFDERYVFNDI